VSRSPLRRGTQHVHQACVNQRTPGTDGMAAPAAEACSGGLRMKACSAVRGHLPLEA
jgi:hypothetical protein